MPDRTLAAYRHFASSVAERLTWVFTVDGYQRGTGKETRAVLRAIREDLRDLHLAVEFPALDTPEHSVTEPRSERNPGDEGA